MYDLCGADLLQLLMIVKVNAHKYADGDWALYKFASKIKHSCRPNLMYAVMLSHVMSPGIFFVQHGSVLDGVCGLFVRLWLWLVCAFSNARWP